MHHWSLLICMVSFLTEVGHIISQQSKSLPLTLSLLFFSPLFLISWLAGAFNRFSLYYFSRNALPLFDNRTALDRLTLHFVHLLYTEGASALLTWKHCFALLNSWCCESVASRCTFCFRWVNSFREVFLRENKDREVLFLDLVDLCSLHHFCWNLILGDRKSTGWLSLLLSFFFFVHKSFDDVLKFMEVLCWLAFWKEFLKCNLSASSSVNMNLIYGWKMKRLLIQRTNLISLQRWIMTRM